MGFCRQPAGELAHWLDSILMHIAADTHTHLLALPIALPPGPDEALGAF